MQLTEAALATLKDRYLLPNETPEQAMRRVSKAFSAGDSELEERMYGYAVKKWIGFSTPVLANGGTDRGLYISCFVQYVPDSIDGLISAWGERSYLTVSGGGLGTYFGAVRSNEMATSRGTKSTGIIPHLKDVESQMLAYSQGSNRRGASAVYLDISHPEFQEFLVIRKPGDTNRRCLERKVFHHAVNIPDSFMEAVKNDEVWNFVDPHSKAVTGSVPARDLWFQILDTRMETGEPYIHFIDTANRGLPKALRDKGKHIYSSQLCCEIELPTSEDETAVCCLSSVNLEYFDEWRTDTKFISDVVTFLDNVLSSFIEKVAEKAGFDRAATSAKNNRDIGIGVMGLHSYLQSKGIPFESAVAVGQSRYIQKHIWTQALKATRLLAIERGEAPDMTGTGRRNAHLIAIAPTATNSIIVGTSPCVEPWDANYFEHRTDSGRFIIKNKHLEEYLIGEGKNTKQVWDSIRDMDGSVQHLDFLSQECKDVFKTAREIDQRWIIAHATQRQEYVDQGQSINLFVDPAVVDRQTLHDIHWQAWEGGLKGLYYVYSKAQRKNENVGSKVERRVLVVNQPEVCVACQ